LGKFKLPEKMTAAPEYATLAREIHYEDENSTDEDGDWGLGIGDWGLGQSPIPNPQSPIPNHLMFI
jgi:hypothetical protein